LELQVGSCFARALQEAAADDFPAAVGLALEDIESAPYFAVLIDDGDLLGGAARTSSVTSPKVKRLGR
jgi:hypothetical protein